MVFFIWIFCAIVTPIVAENKGKGFLTFMFAGIIFGPLALLWVLITPKDEEGIERNMLKFRILWINLNGYKKVFCLEPNNFFSFLYLIINHLIIKFIKSSIIKWCIDAFSNEFRLLVQGLLRK